MQLVNHHAGNIIVISEENKNLLSNVWDYTHPLIPWRGRINLLGGGKLKEDISPGYLVKRELNEEFSIQENNLLDEGLVRDSGKKYILPKISQMASKKEIDLVREAIIQNMAPYKDFLITIPQFTDGPKLTCPNVLFSVFLSKIPQNTFEIIYKNISDKKSLVNDGFLKISSIEELVSGKQLTAWATGRVMEDLFNIKIPNPENISAEYMGLPRSCFNDYLKDFEYVRF